MQSHARGIPSSASVWIVEDKPNYARTVQAVFQDLDDLQCTQVFGSGEELLAHLNEHFAPEVMLVDIGLPGMDGIEVVRRVHGFSPAAQLVMLTIHEDDDLVFDAICAGANGYLLKTATPEVILASAREVLAGGGPMSPAIARRVLNLFAQENAPRWDYQLSDREREVLGWLVEGKTKQQIGSALFISPHTV